MTDNTRFEFHLFNERRERVWMGDLEELAEYWESRPEQNMAYGIEIKGFAYTIKDDKCSVMPAIIYEEARTPDTINPNLSLCNIWPAAYFLVRDIALPGTWSDIEAIHRAIIGRLVRSCADNEDINDHLYKDLKSLRLRALEIIEEAINEFRQNPSEWQKNITAFGFDADQTIKLL